MPKIKKKRVGFVIDMTPLVDITFLLLTFFMFTAKFKTEAESEQKFVVQRPQASADTSKVPEHNLAVIYVSIDSASSDTVYHYAVINEADRQSVYSNMSEQLTPDQQQQAMLRVENLDLLETLIKQTRVANTKTEFAVDADHRIEFKWVDDAMERLRRSQATVFNYVTEKKGA